MKNDISLQIPSTLLYVKIADAIHSYIRQNNLKPGDRLPSERELSKQFQAGRHSVREALRALQKEGVIEVRIGCGTYVAESHQPHALYLDLVKIDYRELMSIKTELEKYSIREVIKKATLSQLSEVEDCLISLEKAREKGIFLPETDKSFHLLLANLSGNKMLIQMISKMIEAFDDFHVLLANNKQFWLDTIPWHRQLLEAIKNRDIAGAEKACDSILEIDIQLIRIFDEAHKNQ